MILEKILAKKRARLNGEKQRNSMAALMEASSKKAHASLTDPDKPGMEQALFSKTKTHEKPDGEPFVIAEVKMASPSKGNFKLQLEVDALVKAYEAAGAGCISVVTEEDFFGGSRTLLEKVKANTNLPLLRKDFIFDAYQVYETSIMEAELLLLIAAIFSTQKLAEFIYLCRSFGIVPLVEIHTKKDLEKALKAGAEVLGINNRDLKNFKTNLDVTGEILPLIPADKTVISESGIKSREDILKLKAMNQKGRKIGVLVGESLVESPKPGEKIKALKGAL